MGCRMAASPRYRHTKKPQKFHRDSIEETADEARRHGLPEVARRPEGDDAGGADLGEGRPAGRSAGVGPPSLPGHPISNRQAHRLHDALQHMLLKYDRQ